ncbi:MAG: helix-turn-helix domain-containing protein [Acutalibacteraceae bacterium]|jgi:putative transcriptional regulator
MIVSYNSLWKLMTNKGFMKTEMRKKSCISISVLAEMGKFKIVLVETHTKITAALNCGFNDIIEVNTIIEKGGKE